MTQEEKAKAYDEALEVAQRFYKNSAAITKKGLEDMFPELADSDDERIRKDIVFYIAANHKDDREKARWLYWLERQGEQKPADKVEPIFNIGDSIAKKHNSDINKFGQFTITDITGGKYWYNDRTICDIKDQDDWELVEQNSAWSEEDERKFSDILALLWGGVNRHYNAPDLSTWFKFLKDRVQPQYKQEWNKEDEKMIGNIRRIIEKYAFSQSAVDVNGDLCEKEYIDADNWLKNLKDRCFSKSKQEVSSDISIVIEDLRELLCNVGQSPDWVFNLRRDIDILNSLKHQCLWKPSDEQMKALNEVIYHVDDSIATQIAMLIGDLKKL